MPDNKPDSIANCIIRAISSPNLDRISKNCAELIRNEFTSEAVVQKYREILEHVERNDRRYPARTQLIS